MALTQEYFKLSDKYQEEYGKNTILLMQVGSFFEMYGNETHSIEAFAKLCDLNMVEKANSAVFMAGFKDTQLDRYTKKIQEAGYTAVIYVQEECKTSRKLDSIISPGTYFSDSPKLTNHVTCIWIDQINYKKGKHVVVGVSSIDIYTGQSKLMEYIEEYHNNPSTYDELERFLSIINPSEVILISNLQEIDKIIQYTGIQCDLIHRIPIVKEDTLLMKRIRNCEKQTYQREILSRYGKEMPEYPMATQSFCYLLDFVNQHNPHLVHKLAEPEWENPNRLVLANHTLKQLNMIDDGSVKASKFSCVSSMLNECSTSMGKRAFLKLLLNPLYDSTMLQKEYDITEYIGDKTLTLSIKDLSKWERTLFLKKTTIASFVTLHQDIETVRNIKIDQVILAYLQTFDVNIHKVESYCEDVLHFIHVHFDLTTESIREGVDAEYDRQAQCLKEAETKLANIQQHINQLLEQKEKKKTDYVKIYETEKSIGLICTKRRAALLSFTTEAQSGSNVYLKMQKFNPYVIPFYCIVKVLKKKKNVSLPFF